MISIIDFLNTHGAQIQAAQLVLGALAGLFALIKLPAMTGASKVCGAFANIDLGRIIRWLASMTPAARAEQRRAIALRAIGAQTLSQDPVAVLLAADASKKASTPAGESMGKNQPP